MSAKPLLEQLHEAIEAIDDATARRNRLACDLIASTRWTTRSLADELGVSHGTVHNWASKATV